MLRLLVVLLLLTRSVGSFSPSEQPAAAAELQRSILTGADKAALALIVQGAPLIAKPGGQTALMLAAYKGNVALVEALLESGSIETGPNARHTADPGADGKTALMYALFGWSSLNHAEHGKAAPSTSKGKATHSADHTRAIKLIAQHKRTDPTVVADDGGSAILRAAKVRHHQALAWLLQSKPTGESGFTTSHTCTDSVATHIRVARLAMPGSSPFGLFHLLAVGTTIFHKTVATLLLTYGSSVPAANLHDSFAAWGLRGLKDGVDIDTGITTNAKPDPVTHDPPDSALDLDLDLGAALAPDGRTTQPVHLHSMVGEWTAALADLVFRHCPATALLPTLGGFTSLEDKHTPLHMAAVAGDAHMVDALLRRSVAKTNGSSSGGGGGSLDIITLLTMRTARSRMTPLHVAAVAGGNPAVVRTILKHVSDNDGGTDAVASILNQRDRQRRIPLEYARSIAVATVLRHAMDAGNDSNDDGDGDGEAAANLESCAWEADVKDEGAKYQGNKAAMTAPNKGACGSSIHIRNGPWMHLHANANTDTDTPDVTSPNGVNDGYESGGSAIARRACDFDIVNAAELSVEKFRSQYVDRSMPVLIRGGASDWPASTSWSPASLAILAGDAMVAVGSIPFASQYGLPEKKQTLRAFIEEHMQGNRSGGEGKAAPEYVFDASILQTQKALLLGLKMPPWFKGYKMHPLQLMIGGRHTGAPMHFHVSAWNALVFGRKWWSLRPPETAVFSKVPAREWFNATVGQHLLTSNSTTTTTTKKDDGGGTSSKVDNAVRHCIQESGDIFFIPSSFSHAVYNLEPSAAVAVEFYAPPL